MKTPPQIHIQTPNLKHIKSLYVIYTIDISHFSIACKHQSIPAPLFKSNFFFQPLVAVSLVARGGIVLQKLRYLRNAPLKPQSSLTTGIFPNQFIIRLNTLRYSIQN